MVRRAVALAFGLAVLAPVPALAASITAVPPADAVEGAIVDVRARGDGGPANSEDGPRIKFFAVPAPADEPCPDPGTHTGNLPGSGQVSGPGPFDVGGTTSFAAGRYRLCAFVTERADPSSTVIASDTTTVFTVRRPRSSISFAVPAAVARKASVVTVSASTEAPLRTVARVSLMRETDGCTMSSASAQTPLPLAVAYGTVSTGSVVFALSIPALDVGRYLLCGVVYAGAPGSAPEATATQLLEVLPAPCIVPTNVKKAETSNLRYRLGKAGCTLGAVTYRENAASQPEDVLELSPQGLHPPGTPINVVVSLGKLCRVPSVLGQTLSTARRRFASSGCTLRFVQRVRRRGKRAGRVVEIRRIGGAIVKPSRSAKPLPNGTKIRMLITR